MDGATESPTLPNQPFPAVKAVLLVLAAAMAVVACLWASPPVARSEAGIMMELPGSIGGYWGTEQPVSEAEREILPEDTEFAKKLYSDGVGGDINCQVVLAGAEKRSIHRPEICLPAQGWTVKSGEVVAVPLEGGGSLDVMQLIVARPIALRDGSRSELPMVFCYWFVGKDATTPHHLVRVLKTNLDILLHNTNHRWAYVIASAPVLEGLVPGGKSLEETRERLRAFIGELAPTIMKTDGGA
jgi:hypothetical protein